MRRRSRFLALMVAVVLAGCTKPDFSDAEKTTIASLALSSLPALKPDTTNRFADVPAAAALGSTLFFDQGMSGDGSISCSKCYKIDRQFQ
ncbi:methylamine utilization protein, partial [Mesorhizobium sp. M7A.T.Ca.TU.009.01.1.1]